MRVQTKGAAAVAKAGGAVSKQQQSKGVAAAPQRRGMAGNGNVRKRGEAAAVPSVAMYDSDDSFENHVIDLRDDLYRGANARDDDGMTPENAQNIEEVSVENGNGRDESGSDTDAIHQNGNGHLSNGKPDKHRKGAKGDETAEEDVNDGPFKHHFVPGQLTWAKYARFPWWPALVMDQRGPLEGKGGSPASDTDVLVRFFGTYDYGWVDPFANLSDFEVKLADRSRLRKKALQKGVEEALEFQSSGKLPDQWEPLKSQNGHTNGVTGSPEVFEVSPAAEEEPKERKTPRKRKPKVLFEEEGRVERKPQRMLRRLRVMRQLGLVAPAGSPFTTDYD